MDRGNKNNPSKSQSAYMDIQIIHRQDRMYGVLYRTTTGILFIKHQNKMSKNVVTMPVKKEINQREKVRRVMENHSKFM